MGTRSEDHGKHEDHGSDEGREAGKTPAEYWEERYAGSEQMWSGRVNAVLADVASGLQPGRALDLGCGEGGDVIWLAQQGWVATGLDISETAVRRAAAAAREAGLGDGRASFRAVDVSALDEQREFDLVTASFFHSPVELERQQILRSAASRVAPGGHLLITSHAEMPPWRQAHVEEHGEEHDEDHPHPELLSPEQEVDSLALDAAEWQRILVETREREATGPDGETAMLVDGVVLLQRVG